MLKHLYHTPSIFILVDKVFINKLKILSAHRTKHKITGDKTIEIVPLNLLCINASPSQWHMLIFMVLRWPNICIKSGKKSSSNNQFFTIYDACSSSPEFIIMCNMTINCAACQLEKFGFVITSFLMSSFMTMNLNPMGVTFKNY